MSRLDTLHRTPCDATRYESDVHMVSDETPPGCMWCLNWTSNGGDCPGVDDPDHAYQPAYGIGTDHGSELWADMARDEP